VPSVPPLKTVGLSRHEVVRRAMALGLTAASIAVLLQACGDDDAPTTATTGSQTGSSSPSTSSPSSGTLVIGWEEDAASLDPPRRGRNPRPTDDPGRSRESALS